MNNIYPLKITCHPVTASLKNSNENEIILERLINLSRKIPDNDVNYYLEKIEHLEIQYRMLTKKFSQVKSNLEKIEILERLDSVNKELLNILRKMFDNSLEKVFDEISIEHTKLIKNLKDTL